MLDKNGKELKTGQIVKIEGSFFKTDNGTYIVKKSPGNPSWCGKDYSLVKCNRKGEESTAKHNICFWPLGVFVNSREKSIEARKHNKENATIEIIGEVRTYNVKITQRMGWNDYEYEDILTEKSYNEALQNKFLTLALI